MKEQFNKDTNNKLNRQASCKRLFEYAQFEGEGSAVRFFIASDTKKVFILLNGESGCGIYQVGFVGKNGKYNYKQHWISLIGISLDRTEESCFITTFYDIRDGDLIEYKSDKCSATYKSKEIVQTRFRAI